MNQLIKSIMYCLNWNYFHYFGTYFYTKYFIAMAIDDSKYSRRHEYALFMAIAIY